MQHFSKWHILACCLIIILFSIQSWNVFDCVGSHFAFTGDSNPDVSAANGSDEKLSIKLRTDDRPSTMFAAWDAPNFPSNKATGLRVAVCVVGQAQRLELVTKATNVVEKNVDDGAHVAIFGVMDGGAAKYSKKNKLKGMVNQCYNDGISDSIIIEEFVETFKKKGAMHVQIELGTPLAFMITDELAHMFRKLYTNEKAMNNPQVLQNVLRSYTHDKECADNIELFEHKWGFKFDVVMRMRDNSVVDQPMSLRTLADSESKCLLGSDDEICVLTKDCATWGYINDKFWVIPRGLLLKTLGSMVKILNSAPPALADHPASNTEQLVQQVWNYTGAKLKMLNVSQMPVWDGLCRRSGDLINTTPLFLPASDCANPSKWIYEKHIDPLNLAWPYELV